jgi:Tol biopolymer transport system component
VAISAVPATASPAATTVATVAPASAGVQTGDPWIAFQWQRGPGDGILLMRPDGTDTHPLFDAPKPDTFHPDWSADGSQLAYEVAGAHADDIGLANADGSAPTILVDRSSECASICGDVAYPAWSPDGRSVAFIRFDFEGEVHHGCAIEVIDVATGSRRVVYAGPAGTVLDYPRWSPDGGSIVFEATAFPDKTLPRGAATGSTISIIDAVKEGAEPRVLTKPSEFATYPDWNPTTDLIVFTTYDLGEFQATDEPSNLYTIRPDGTALSPLTSYGRGGQRATQPTWTPDGTRILFTLVGQNPGFDSPRRAAFIDADGANLQVLTGSATHPRLRPVP